MIKRIKKLQKRWKLSAFRVWLRITGRYVPADWTVPVLDRGKPGVLNSELIAKRIPPNRVPSSIPNADVCVSEAKLDQAYIATLTRRVDAEIRAMGEEADERAGRDRGCATLPPTG